jgi:cardiolipin synthase
LHTFHIIELISFVILMVLLLLVLFEPPLRYTVRPMKVSTDSPDFLRLVAGLADAQLHHSSSVELLSDGKVFYEAELLAISRSTRSVHLEAFIFHPGRIGERFLDALIERAKAGIAVKVVVDAVGSLPTPKRFFAPLLAAGGDVQWYQPVRFSTLKRLNNRTHRELIVIDGTIGFIGGAGIAAHWDTGDKGKPPWRDMMFRVDRGLASGLQTTFAENWLEASGSILSVPEDFPQALEDSAANDGVTGMVIVSSPTAGRSTRNRVLFQTLIAAAQKSICVHSPYFLPDQSATAELVCAAQERGVKIKIIVPGSSNNHKFTRLASRRRYGELLKAGVEIHEYQPGMIHTKTMTIDGLWSVVGSTNFDSRSFDLNDEVNLVAANEKLATTIQQEFASDLTKSLQITYDAWQRRSLAERCAATLGRVFERQE